VSLPLDPTVGGAASNAYVALDEAAAYFDSRPNATAWTALNNASDTQESALITATARIDQEQYRGARASSTQALAWPRTGVHGDGYTISSTVLPRELKAATCEMALAILVSGATDLLAAGGDAIASVDVGGVKVAFRDPRTADSQRYYPHAVDDPATTLPAPVYRLLRPWLLTGQRIRSGTVRLVRS
jgi:hypothetical protein